MDDQAPQDPIPNDTGPNDTGPKKAALESPGELQPSEQLLETVYHELRRLAQARLAREGPAASLVPTELVHEAFLRLEHEDAAWNGPHHYFAAAAESMRRILVDRARARGALKRGGRRPMTLIEEPAVEDEPESLVELDAALSALEERDERLALLVKLRYFAGLTEDQAAAAMGVSARTARRDWATARAWLRMRIEGDSGE